MAGTKRAEKSRFKRSSKKRAKSITDQLEQKWIGTGTDVFSLITAKEAEIRSKVNEEKEKARRIVEDAKGQAAAIKREATFEEIAKDVRGEIIRAAQEDAKGIEASTAGEIAKDAKTAERNMDKAVDFIVEYVVFSRYPGLNQPVNREI